MTLGEKIKLFRKEKGLTQKQLGKACNPSMSAAAVRQYELGKRNPKIETVQKIAQALNIPAGCLFNDDDIDYEYEQLCDILESAGIHLEEYGFNAGGGPENDVMLISHINEDEEPISIKYGDLLNIVKNILSDAEQKKNSYIQKRLDLELF